MGLDKAIESGKAHRHPDYGAKAIDVPCRNHGSCGWCENNRLYGRNKQDVKCKQALDEYKMERG